MSWKDKLDDLQNLQEESWDKNHAWENLHRRLKKKSPSKNIVYWMAGVAACLLLILGIQWFSTNEIKKDVVTRKLQKTPDKLTKKEIPVVNTDKNSSEKIPLASTAKATSNKTQEKNSSVPRVLTSVSNTANAAEKYESDKVLPDENFVTMPAEDTISVLVTTKPPKKLKVVHINELGKPAEEKVRLVHRRGTIKNEFDNEGFLRNFPHSIDDNIIKIKLSPHN